MVQVSPFFLVLLGSVICSLSYGLFLTRRPVSNIRTLVKTLPVFMLGLAVVYVDGPSLLIAGLFLGSLGDAFLSRDGEKAFLLGLSSFLFGHLAFAVLFFQSGVGIESIWNEPWRLILALLVFTIALVMLKTLAPRLGDLKIPVFVYIAVIFVMGVAAFQMPTDGAMIWVVVGAVMFIASDAILAFELFIWEETNPIRKISAPLLWFLYWGGQMLFVFGFLQ